MYESVLRPFPFENDKIFLPTAMNFDLEEAGLQSSLVFSFT
jgi:hypothetical protein